MKIPQQLLDLVSDQDLTIAFAGSNFGTQSKRDALAEGLLHVACGFKTGHTMKEIMIELKLMTELKGKRALTPEGRHYLYGHFAVQTQLFQDLERFAEKYKPLGSYGSPENEENAPQL